MSTDNIFATAVGPSSILGACSRISVEDERYTSFSKVKVEASYEVLYVHSDDHKNKYSQ